MEVIQQLNPLLHPCILERVVTDNTDGTYNEPPQSWGEWDPAIKASEVPYTQAKHFVRILEGVGFCGPGMEKICDRFTFLTLENHVDQPPVVFSVSEYEGVIRFPWIEVAKAKFQTDEKKGLPILKIFAVLVYRRAPLIGNLRQAQGSGFQLGQIA